LKKRNLKIVTSDSNTETDIYQESKSLCSVSKSSADSSQSSESKSKSKENSPINNNLSL
jgi:hypothetical protein